MAVVQNGFDQLALMRERSVKTGDLPPGGTTVLQLFVPTSPMTTLLPQQLPGTLWQRDKFLSITPRADAQWGCAVGIGIAKVASLAWDVKGDVRLRSRRGFDIIMNADSATSQGGWISYASKQVRDYTCTNMGAVTEIVRETLSYGSRIVGINHLPAVRCRRTGDPERPILYITKDGREHILRDWQVMYFSDLPDPDEISYGGGLCAAERAYPQIVKMASLENYVYEKISGSRPLAIHIVNGLRIDQIEGAIRQAEADQQRAGYTSYMGAVVMATIKPDAAPSVATIDLAELPDGFDAVNERARADLIYANALGLDLQDLVPLSNTPLGTAAQSKVLHDKSKGKGLILFRQQFVHAINKMVLDDKTKFLFSEKSYDDQMARARISRENAIVAGQRIKSGITTPQEERQMLVDQHELPMNFVQSDLTPEASLSDTDKPGFDDRDVDPIPPPDTYTGHTIPLNVPRDTVDRDGQGIAGMGSYKSKSLQRVPDRIVKWADSYRRDLRLATEAMIASKMSVTDWDTYLHVANGTYVVAGFLSGIHVNSVDQLDKEEEIELVEIVNDILMETDDLVAQYSTNEISSEEVISRIDDLSLYIKVAYDTGAELL